MSRLLVSVLGLPLLLTACSGATPRSVEDCAGLGDPTARDDCYARLLPEVFRVDPAKGIELTESAVTDPTVRDFIWLTVTRDVDPNTNKYCNRISDAVLADRCRVLVSRPHLHRGLVDGEGKTPRSPGGGPPPGGPPGGPPPGGPPPGGGPGAAPGEPPPGGAPGEPPPGGAAGEAAPTAP